LRDAGIELNHQIGRRVGVNRPETRDDSGRTRGGERAGQTEHFGLRIVLCARRVTRGQDDKAKTAVAEARHRLSEARPDLARRQLAVVERATAPDSELDIGLARLAV